MSLFACGFTVLCAVILPIGAGVFLCMQKRGFWRPILVGAFTFVLFQLLLRLPVLQMVMPHMDWFVRLSLGNPLLYSLFLGATAGIFEECGRYLTMRFLLKKTRSVLSGIAFGVGHGGIEAILLVGINGVFTLILAGDTAPAGSMFAAGVERLSAMAMHVGWSVMVLKSIRERKPLWLLWAFCLHTLIDTAASSAMVLGLPVWGVELALVAVALAMILFVVKEYRKKEEILT